MDATAPGASQIDSSIPAAQGPEIGPWLTEATMDGFPCPSERRTGFVVDLVDSRILSVN